jgi:hypothetical protein
MSHLSSLDEKIGEADSFARMLNAWALLLLRYQQIDRRNAELEQQVIRDGERIRTLELLHGLGKN